MFGFEAFWLRGFYAYSDLDAMRYSFEGSRIALLLRGGMWSDIDWSVGTNAVSLWAGAVYSIAGPNVTAMYFQGTVVGLIATLVLARSAEVALPATEGRWFTLFACFSHLFRSGPAFSERIAGQY